MSPDLTCHSFITLHYVPIVSPATDLPYLSLPVATPSPLFTSVHWCSPMAPISLGIFLSATATGPLDLQPPEAGYCSSVTPSFILLFSTYCVSTAVQVLETLSAVSVTHSQLWTKTIKWKIPEIDNSLVLNQLPF